MKVKCGHCGKDTEKRNSDINRAKKQELSLYCNRECSGLGRRTTKEEKIEGKRLYDIKYRENNVDILRTKKAKYFQKVYAANPEKFRLERQRKMEAHKEYCRTPEYREWKKAYDRVYKAKLHHGDLWESHILVQDIATEIDKYEAMLSKGTLCKVQKRKANINY